MLKPKITTLPGHIQSVYVHNFVKLYTSVVIKAEKDDNEDVVKEVSQLLSEKLPLFIQSADLEVQERVSITSFRAQT